jgi:hypothetical protein
MLRFPKGRTPWLAARCLFFDLLLVYPTALRGIGFLQIDLV